MERNNKFKTNREAIRERSEKDTINRISELSKEMSDKGYSIQFGSIGKKTTYCLLTKDPDEEIVGYTFIKDSRYLNVNVGKLKALQQAIARKELLEERAKQQAAEGEDQ